MVPDQLRPLRRTGAGGGPHLTAQEIAGYLDATVLPAGRRRIEAHLVRCERCLGEVLAAFEQLSRGDTRRRE